jgi:hypothetical protein
MIASRPWFISSGLVNNASVFRLAHPAEMTRPATARNAEILQRNLVRIFILLLPGRL